MHACVQVYVRVSRYTCMCVGVRAYVKEYVCLCLHLCVPCVSVSMCALVCVLLCLCMCMCVRTINSQGYYRKAKQHCP